MLQVVGSAAVVGIRPTRKVTHNNHALSAAAAMLLEQDGTKERGKGKQEFVGMQANQLHMSVLSATVALLLLCYVRC